MLVVKLFNVFCKTQRFRISWNGCESREYAIHKSVRQGGVLSPYLINLYVNGLGVKLFASRIGCHIGHVATNNIWYADDLCLLAPSIYALQNMINICNHCQSS